MSSSARKLRRKMNRALPGMSNEDAVLVMSALAGAEKRAKEDRAEKTLKAANDVYDKLHAEINVLVLPMLLHDFMALFFAYLRDKQGFGQQRLEKAAKEVEEYFGGIFEAEIPVEDIVTEIRRECGFDIDKTFERIYAAWGNQKLEERENVE